MLEPASGKAGQGLVCGFIRVPALAGTRIIYDRKFLMECRNSPVTKTPPRDLPTIPGVTSPKTGDELPHGSQPESP